MLFRVFSWKGDWSSNEFDTSGCGGTSRTAVQPFDPPTTHGAFNDTDARFWCPGFWGADTVGWWGEDSGWNPELCR
jgi:hypothetical protein